MNQIYDNSSKSNPIKAKEMLPAFHTAFVQTEDAETFHFVEAYSPFSAFEQKLENEQTPSWIFDKDKKLPRNHFDFHASFSGLFRDFVPNN